MVIDDQEIIKTIEKERAEWGDYVETHKDVKEVFENIFEALKALEEK